jgi:hypothetical protein
MICLNSKINNLSVSVYVNDSSLCLHNTDLGVEYPSYRCRQKVQILLFTPKFDTLSVLNIENKKHFVFKNRGAAPLNHWELVKLSSAYLYVSGVNDWFFVVLRIDPPQLLVCRMRRVNGQSFGSPVSMLNPIFGLLGYNTGFLRTILSNIKSQISKTKLPIKQMNIFQTSIWEGHLDYKGYHSPDNKIPDELYSCCFWKSSR